MSTWIRAFACCGLLGLAGCGHLSFRDGGGKEVGLKAYTPKPYLLVARTGDKDKPVEVNVVYLPDLANPIYVYPIPGWGSANLKVELSNGMITSFGQETDPKIADLLNSIGGLATSFAGARKTLSEIKALEQAASTQDGMRIQRAATEIQSILGDRAAATLDDADRAALRNAAADLKSLGDAVADVRVPRQDARAVAERLGIVARSLEPQRMRLASTDALGARVAAVRRDIDAIAQSLRDAAELPVLELYEIDVSSGRTVLRRMPVETKKP